MSDLAERLLDAIGERERLASEATPGPWRIRGHESDLWIVRDSQGGRLISDEGTLSDADAAHITANDPAVVLATCAAHRRIVERHALVLDGPRVGLCDYCDSEGVTMLMTWPCPDWLDVASIYGIKP